MLARLKAALPFGGDGHDHPSAEEATDRGIWGIAAFAFALAFANQEEFEIIPSVRGRTSVSNSCWCTRWR